MRVFCVCLCKSVYLYMSVCVYVKDALSSLMARREHEACALPEKLLLDEPLSGLDAPTKSKIIEDLRARARAARIEDGAALKAALKAAVLERLRGSFPDLPVVIITGYARKYLNQFGWTMSISILISMLVAFTLLRSSSEPLIAIVSLPLLPVTFVTMATMTIEAPIRNSSGPRVRHPWRAAAQLVLPVPFRP